MPNERRRIRLAVVSTHPIQYYAPLFRALATSPFVVPRVFYTWSHTAEGSVFDPGFGRSFKWNVPLLNGYDHVFLPNVANRPGSNHFLGIRNPQLTPAIERWGADAVLVFGWNLHSHLGALRHFSGRIPVMFRGDSTLLNPQKPLRRLLRKLFLRWVYSHVDMAVAVGTNNRDYFRWCGLAPEKLALAPHCIDTERFGDASGEHAARADEWRRELGIPPDAVAFLYAAKFIPQKDPGLLLDAFRSLGASAHLVYLGEGELELALRARAADMRNVHFLPFQNQLTMPTVYRLGDALVLPSCSETWGLAMNEAMASGRPVIASSRVGGARDMIEEGVTGWSFSAMSRDDLARTLRTAMSLGREGLRHMGETCRNASIAWSPENSAAAIAAAAVRAVG
jgi:glycosyltransferase involved in cell wall biosynthesis